MKPKKKSTLTAFEPSEAPSPMAARPDFKSEAEKQRENLERIADALEDLVVVLCEINEHVKGRGR